MDDRAHFRELLLSLGDAFAEEPRPGGKLAAQALRCADMGAYRRKVSEADPASLLAAAGALPAALSMVEHVLGCQGLLDWTCWSGEGLDGEVSRRLFTTELVGPDGHIPADNVRVGLLASQPWTDYPISSHSGEETYLVLAGVAEWVVDGSDYVERQPGAFVHHPAWAKHGRRTKEEPFFGAWRWSGDLDLSTFSIA